MPTHHQLERLHRVLSGMFAVSLCALVFVGHSIASGSLTAAITLCAAAAPILLLATGIPAASQRALTWLNARW